MIEKKLLKKIIRDYFKQFAQQNKFTFLKPTLMVREHNDVLHIINFDIPYFSFYCNIAIQPLYIPEEHIVLSFGNRLNHFKEKLAGKWGYGEHRAEVEQDLAQVKELLERNVLPWFDEVGDPEGIVTFIERGYSEDPNLIVAFPPFLRNLYLGFSYLYSGHFELGFIAFDKILDELKEDTRPWVLEMLQLVSQMKLLALSEPEKVKNSLDQFVEQTKISLKMKV